MFSSYYQHELAFLRELGREFGLHNPGLADALTERGADPDVERLLEGFAFLAARIHERADAAIPELLEPLAELIAPQTLRGLPAATILELTPRHSAMRARHRVEAGSSFGSRPVGGVVCPFRTTEPIELAPLWLDESRLDVSRSSAPEIVLAMRAAPQALGAVFCPGPLRLFFACSPALASSLVLWCARHLDSVAVRAKAGTFELGRDALAVPALDPARPSLWPWHELAPAGPRLLAEYFAFPEAHHFAELRGLERVPEAARVERFELVLRFSRPPALPEVLPGDAVRIGCVPAINLFSTAAEPIRRDGTRAELLLRAAGLPPTSAEVSSVEQVVGQRAKRGGRIEYTPLRAFDHDDQSRHLYELRRRRSPLDGAIDTYLRLPITAAELAEETVSVEMTCSSRRLVHALRAGDVGAPLPSSPSLVTARNVSRVSSPVPTPLGSELQSRLLGQMAVANRSLQELDAFRALLGLYAVPDAIDPALARANGLRIESLCAIRVSAGARPFRTGASAGAMIRGIEVRLELEQARFESEGDVFLFGCALERLLADEIPLNSYSALAIAQRPTQRELRWLPRTGTRALI